jgi:hypothetical protein
MKQLFISSFRLIISLTIISLGFMAVIQQHTQQAKAVGDFTVIFPSTPFFNETNLAPGAIINKTLTVHNDIVVPRMASIKATNVTRSPGLPKLDEILTLDIKDGATTLFTGHLSDFLNNTNPDGMQLDIINPGVTKSYAFHLELPTSAGNIYQNRSVQFDVTVGSVLNTDIVINEVFYSVDPQHGEDCSVQGSHFTPKKTTGGNCDEWVELFNGSNHDISLKNWQIVDDSGIVRTIHANKSIRANGFALLTKSNREFARFWSVPKSTEIIELGQYIGDGLGNNGDHLLLMNSTGVLKDSISWGTNSTAGIPHYAGALGQGKSLERLVPGFDTDSGTDFHLQSPPTPGQ